MSGGRTSTVKTRKKIKKVVSSGCVHIYASFNNTIVSVTDLRGNVIVWKTSGGSGFKGSRKSTPYAAGIAAKNAVIEAKDYYGLASVEIHVKGPGTGREAAIRAVGELLEITKIIEKTSIPHNGCRPEKERRV